MNHSKDKSPKMFDRIAHRYDFLNRVLSMGIDVSWRKQMAKFLPERANLKLLDLATGTADQILYLLGSGKIESAVGLDLSEGMLSEGRKKILELGLQNKVRLDTGDACDLQVIANSFDVVTISFGIRNVPDVQKALNEMYRSLKPGGKAMILEFSIPESEWIKKPYLFYFRNILPRIGATISGDTVAYKYLNSTVEDFPYGKQFLNLMNTVGFQNLHQESLTFGIASIYTGTKPEVQA